MAFTFYNGTPPDSYGSDGDGVVDYKNNVVWGPRGQITAGSWVGTARSLQGQPGLALLGYNGVPPSGQGSPGNAGCDTSTGNLYLKSASGWAQTGSMNLTANYSSILQGAGPPNSSTAPNVATGQMYFDNVNNLMWGPSTSNSYAGLTQVFNMVGVQGPPGTTTMAAAGWGVGPFHTAVGVALSSTPQVITAQGTSVPQTYTPGSPSALIGVGITCNNAAVTCALYDVTASATVYSVSVSNNSNNWLGPFSTTAYPMVAGHQYVWQISGSGTTTAQISPIYLVPAAAAVQAVNSVANWATPTSTAFSSTATNTYSAGIKAASSKSFYFLRAGSLYSGSATYTPSASGAASASVQLQIGTYTPNVAAATVYTSPAIPNTGALVNFGPFQPGTYQWSSGYLLYVNVIGSGTGQVNVDLNLIV